MTPAQILSRAADILEARGWLGTDADLFIAINDAAGLAAEQHENWAAAVELARRRAVDPDRMALDLLGGWASRPGRTQAQVVEMLRGRDWRQA